MSTLLCTLTPELVCSTPTACPRQYDDSLNCQTCPNLVPLTCGLCRHNPCSLVAIASAEKAVSDCRINSGFNRCSDCPDFDTCEKIDFASLTHDFADTIFGR